ncbi:methyltransferase [Iodidimonas muriae]|uniref:Methyltransferase n=1 Tax=Iodidimonas muriae TaxID=261467 RepID=A0ABQ2LEL8_9PROT|nr:methyltransferase [Iodidimonas muriae]GER07603.1 methyltransferase [Kordiimonadales bacterium JCM 17843]GGO13768.1 methyltransferase [Iodidimonas muriae]
MALHKVNAEGLTEDLLLGGRVRLLQPHRGVRVSIDTVLLASVMAPRPGERVIEAGAGSGGAALCVAARCPDVALTGIDIDPDMVDLAKRNAALNGFEDRVAFLNANVTDRPAILGRGQFHHAMANPPYFEERTCFAPPTKTRARAFIDQDAVLGDWVHFCLDMVCDKGTVSFIHRADRLDELIALLYGRAGEMAVFPLWPKAGLPAKRVIVQARKAMKGTAMHMPGLVLHDPGGAFSEQTEAVLRDARNIDLSRAGWSRLMHPQR